MKRAKTWLLIAIGGAASIATTSVAWNLQERASGTPIALDAQVTSARYLVHAELQGPGPFQDVAGDLFVSVGLKARLQPTTMQTASVEIHWLGHPDEPIRQVMVPIVASPMGAEEYDELPVWDACTSPPCIEEAEVVIARDPSLDLPSIDVTVNAEAQAYSTNESRTPPDSTQVIIRVEGPL